MPKSISGIFAMVIMSLVMTSISIFIINRIPPLRQAIAAAA